MAYTSTLTSNISVAIPLTHYLIITRPNKSIFMFVAETTFFYYDYERGECKMKEDECSLVNQANYSSDRAINENPNSRWRLSQMLLSSATTHQTLFGIWTSATARTRSEHSVSRLSRACLGCAPRRTVQYSGKHVETLDVWSLGVRVTQWLEQLCSVSAVNSDPVLLVPALSIMVRIQVRAIHLYHTVRPYNTISIGFTSTFIENYYSGH